MSHWHLTIAETALCVPAGVVLGAVVSYFAVRYSTRATLAVQRAALDDARAQASEQRRADLEREERDHRRAAYTELGGHLQSIADACNYIVAPVLAASLKERDVGQEGAGQGWDTNYMHILDSVPACRRLASVYGSPQVRAAVNALGALTRTLAPPASLLDSPDYWMHALSCQDGGIATTLITLNSDRQMHETMLGNVRILESIVRFGVAQIRHETLPSSAAAPIRPDGVTDDPDAGAYAAATYDANGSASLDQDAQTADR